MAGKIRPDSTLLRAVAIVLGVLCANFLIVVPAFLVQPDIRMETLRPVAMVSLAISGLSLLALIVQLGLLLRAVRPDSETRRRIVVRALVSNVIGLVWGVFKLTEPPSGHPPAQEDGT